MRGSLVVALVMAFVSGIAPGEAHAEFGIAPGSLTAQMLDSAGDPETRAGAHPNLFRVSFAFNLIDGKVEGNVRDIEIKLPPGLVGDPTATPTCPRGTFSVVNLESSCPAGAQIGKLRLETGDLTLAPDIVSVEPGAGSMAEFGFRGFGFDGHLAARMSPDGRAIVITMNRVVEDFPPYAMAIDLWGVPADHQVGGVAPRRAFLTAPTRCDAPPVVEVNARSWQEPDVWRSVSTEAGSALVGCKDLSFDPRVDLELGGTRADTPTGLRMGVTLPQNDDPDGLASARLEDVSLKLPAGMSLSPGVANGLTACPPDGAGLGTNAKAACPASSKVGTLEVDTPLLDQPLSGSLYMGRQLPGTDYQVFAIASGPGINLKFDVVLHADPETGQLSARLRDLPEMPIDRFELTFAGGPRASLVSPLSCGGQTLSATLTPWGGGPSVESSDSAAITADPSGRPCSVPQSFAPSFVAGMSPARAGAKSPLAVTIRRHDGEQLLDGFSTTLPPGVSASIASVRQCSSAAAVAASCPLASRVGSVATEVGSGSSPFVLHGDAFLTGPYRGAPFGLALVFRAVAGPFDLGTISVRASLSLDSRTGQVTVDSDSLPQVVRGIPLRMQTVALDVDRPGFMANPTSCAAAQVVAAVRSAGGAVSHLSSRFAVGGCAGLRFRPAMSMALINRPELRKGGHPGLRLRLRPTPHGANVREANIALPKLLGPAVIGPGEVCSLRQVDRERCPAASRIGGAVGRTPLLGVALKGSIYMAQPPKGAGLPDLWAIMRGMGVSVKFRMRTVLDHGQVHAKLVDVPDIALSSFELTFAGGKHGMFSATADPCRHGHAKRLVAKGAMLAHSGAKRSISTRVRVAGGC